MGDGQGQPEIKTTTTLPAKPLVPSLAALVAGGKTLAEIQTILGIDEKEARSRLEAAELFDKVATVSTAAAAPAAEASTVSEPVAESSAAPAAEGDGFQRKRGRSARATATAAAPPKEETMGDAVRAAAGTVAPQTTATADVAQQRGELPTAPAAVTRLQVEVSVKQWPVEMVELTDEAAMALGRLAALAMNAHVSVEKILENALVVLRAQKRLP